MEYIESMGYFHRDLRADNILLDRDETAKIGDFGLSRDQKTYSSSFRSKFPFRWASPEVWSARSFSIESDVWSFAILVTEVFSHGKQPYRNFTTDQVRYEILILFDLYRMSHLSNYSFDLFSMIFIKIFKRLTQERKIMDRPQEIKMDKLWSLCQDCMCFTPIDRPSFTDIRERLEKIIDKSQRRLPISKMMDLFDTSQVQRNDPDSDSIGDIDYTEVYYGYIPLNKTKDSSAYASASSTYG